MFRDDVDAFLDHAAFVVLPHPAQHLGIGATVAEYIVTALLNLFNDLRILVTDRGIQQDRCGQLELVEDFKEAPVADPISIIPPGVIARGLRASTIVRVDAEARLKRKVLDVKRDIKREPFTARP